MVLVKKIIKVILSLSAFFIMLFLLIIASANGIFELGRLAKGVNQTSISSVQLGMSECDVIKILGVPFTEVIYPEYNEHYFTYSNDGYFWGVEIYVNFENRKVSSIYMEEGDVPFYIYDKNNLSRKINHVNYNRIIPNAPNLEKKRYDEIHSKTP